MEKIATDTYSFEKLRRGAFTYVDKTGRDAAWAFDEVVTWYDGYRFHPDSEKVINPVSFGLCSRCGEFQNYWSTTALTTFLVDAIKKHPLNFAKVDIDQRTLEAYEPEHPQLTTLLYQTG